MTDIGKDTYVVTEDLGTGGGEYFWSFTGEHSIVELAERAGDILPVDHALFAPTVPSEAIRRAADLLVETWGPNLQVSQAIKGGLVVLRKGLDRAGDQVHAQIAHVWMDGSRPRVTTRHGEDVASGLPGLQTTADAQDALDTLYQRCRTSANASSLGARMAKVCSDMGGISLRNRGGVWYVPPAGDPTVRKLKVILESMGAGQVSRFPIMRAGDAAEAILRGLTDEVADGAVEIEEWISKREGMDNDSKHFDNSVTLRDEKIRETEAKVRQYETQLGLNVQDLADKLAKLRARVVGLRLLKLDAEQGRKVGTGDRGRLDLDDVPMTDPQAPDYRGVAERFAMIEWK